MSNQLDCQENLLLWGDETSRMFCFHRCSISLKRCYNLDLTFQVSPGDRSTFVVSKLSLSMCKGFRMKRLAQTGVGMMGEALQVGLASHSCCCYYAAVTPAMAFQQCSPELVSSWDGLPDESFPRALCLCCAGCLIFQIPPTSLSPYVRSLLDVLRALSHLTFMVDIVTFEVGTISLFLVGNIEVLRN